MASGRVSPRVDEDLADKFEYLAGLAWSLLYDLLSWMANDLRPVPSEQRLYQLNTLRDLPSPQERLAQYVNPDLLASWEEALAPFFDAGLRLAPEVGEKIWMNAEGLDGGGRITLTLKFSDRSPVINSEEVRAVFPKRLNWALTLILRPDLEEIVSASLQPDISAQ